MRKWLFLWLGIFCLSFFVYAQDDEVDNKTPLIIPLPLTQPLPGTTPPLPLPESLLAPPSKDLNRMLPGTVPPVPLRGTPTLPPDETRE